MGKATPKDGTFFVVDFFDVEFDDEEYNQIFKDKCFIVTAHHNFYYTFNDEEIIEWADFVTMSFGKEDSGKWKTEF